MFSLLLVLVFLMAGGSKGGKRRRSPTPQPLAVEVVESDYVPKDESDDDTTDWENLPIESLTRTKAKGYAGNEKGKRKAKETEKGKAKETEKGKGKATETGKGKVKKKAKGVRGRRKSIGIEIQEPTHECSSSESPVHSFFDDPIDPQRRSMYSSKLCIGEHYVGVKQLIKHVPTLQTLFENGDLYEICNFSEQTGYGLELIREFYMRAGFLEDTDGGPYSFGTSVCGVSMTITPDEIASVTKMVAQTDGIDYLNSGFNAV